MSRPTISLARLLAEGFAVVVGILIAFGLDAWWDGRGLERELQEDLSSLATEVSQNLSDIRGTIDVQKRIVDAANQIVEYLEADSSASVLVPDTLVWWAAFNAPTLDASLGAIDALVGAGRLAGIEDPALRLGIAKIRGRIADVVEEQVVARQIAVEQVVPLLGEGGADLEPIQRVSDAGVTPRPSLGVGFRPVPSFGSMEVQNSPSLRFALRARAIWYIASNQEMAGLEDVLQETLEGIEAYRSGGS